MVCCIVFAVSNLFAQQKTVLDSLKYTTEKGAYVKLVGKTKGVYQKKLDSVTVKVFVGNKLFYNNYFPIGTFDIALPLDQKLSLEIYRRGYYPKRIAVNTEIPQDKKKPYYLVFDFYMIEKSKLKGLDDFILDFPTGLVAYYPEKFRFHYSEKYTKQMFRELNRLIKKGEESQTANQ